MLQNILIGPISVILGYFWVKMEKAQVSPESNSMSSGKSSLDLLWERFPKFVLGFIVVNVIFNTTIPSSQRTTLSAFSFVVSGISLI